eukprot:IDg21873t1
MRNEGLEGREKYKDLELEKYKLLIAALEKNIAVKYRKPTGLEHFHLTLAVSNSKLKLRLLEYLLDICIAYLVSESTHGAVSSCQSSFVQHMLDLAELKISILDRSTEFL